MSSIHEHSISTGITKIHSKGKDYTFWTNASVVTRPIFNFIKANFPESIIIREFNNIDIVVVDKKLPIEIQSTIVVRKKTSKHGIGIHHSVFEQYLMKQVKENVKRYDKCWIFIDAQFVRYIKNFSSRARRSNFEWLSEYYQRKEIRIFTVDYLGSIKELNPEELIIKRDEQRELLDKNKHKIALNVLRGHEYSSKEIRGYRKIWKSEETKGFQMWLKKENHEYRVKLVGYILQSLSGGEKYINLLFNREESKISQGGNKQKEYSKWLGILESGKTGHSSMFVDKYDIAKYFPGYLKNKEFWDSIKNKELSPNKFKRMVFMRGAYDWGS